MPNIYEVEVNVSQVFEVDLDELKDAFPAEWEEYHSDEDGDEGEVRDFISDTLYETNADPRFFRGTPYNDRDVYVTKKKA